MTPRPVSISTPDLIDSTTRVRVWAGLCQIVAFGLVLA